MIWLRKYARLPRFQRPHSMKNKELNTSRDSFRKRLSKIYTCCQKEAYSPTQIQNLKDEISFLHDEGCEKICVLGLSLGAAIAILTLAEKPVDALITWSAVSDFQKLFDVLAPAKLKENKNALEHFEYNGWILKRTFWNDALSHDIQEKFIMLKMPKLILQGDADEEVFVDGMRQFMDNAYPPCDFYEIPGAGHTYQGVHYTKKLLSVTTQWLKRHF